MTPREQRSAELADKPHHELVDLVLDLEDRLHKVRAGITAAADNLEAETTNVARWFNRNKKRNSR